MRLTETRLLARTFFARFFESELMPAGLPQVQLVIWSMAFLATPGLLLPARFAGQYTQTRDPHALAQAFLMHRLLFITLTMTALGLVALVIWDGMFPDRRDARILTPLPVPGHVLIVARLLALGALAGIFLAGVNLIPTLVYGPVAAAFGGASSLIRGALAHLIATTLAGLFVFCTLVMLQGLVLNIGGRQAAERMAVVLQVLFIVALLQLIFFLPRVGSVLRVGFADVWSDPWLRLMPSVWFVALYDVLDGVPAPQAWPLAVLALAASAFVTTAAIAIGAATHARLTRLALETRDGGAAARVRARLSAVLVLRICPQATARAILEFTLRTLVRSRSHRLLLSMYLGFALALVVSAIVPLLIRRGLAGFAEPSLEILSAPLVLGFFALVGMRVAVAIPVEPRANWIIRLLEPSDRVSAMRGVRLAMVLAGVLPTTLLGAMSAGVLWGVPAGLAHGIACALMGSLLVEILMLRLDKLPFTCTYFPGRSRVGLAWPLYLTAFITYAYSAAAWELAMVGRPLVMAGVGSAIALAIVILRVRNGFAIRRVRGFRFVEEDPDTLFTGFQLSEGFAAATEDVRRLR